MIESWRDSWFEEGTRLFHIVPRTAIDAILPLEIDPTPAGVARVFVGRMELVTPATEKEIKDALLANDVAALRGLWTLSSGDRPPNRHRERARRSRVAGTTAAGRLLHLGDASGRLRRCPTEHGLVALRSGRSFLE